MQHFLPADLSHRDRHQLLLSGVAPRPIALVSTVNQTGTRNLSPFSFFNAFASRPPVVAIGPAISAKTGATKDTWENLMETRECTISICNYAMVQAINLASSEYARGVDEFVKSGLTPSNSFQVRAPWVKESFFAMECTLMQNIALRRDIGGNGNITLLEVVQFHVADEVLVEGRIDPRKMDYIARMGYDHYCRVTPESVFEVHKPTWVGVGVDALPESVRLSTVLTGNDLAQLAGIEHLPNNGELYSGENLPEVHRKAQELLHAQMVAEAWEVLVSGS